MSYTNQTANYGLPQYTADDKPTYLGDFNKAMLDIDTAIKANETVAQASQTLAQNANNSASEALSTANTASSSATNAGVKADNAYALAESAKADATQATTDATDAKTIANSANQTATSANATATSAQTTATNANNTATSAQEAINSLINNIQNWSTPTNIANTSVVTRGDLQCTSNSFLKMITLYGNLNVTINTGTTIIATLPDSSLFPSSDITIRDAFFNNGSGTPVSLTLNTSGQFIYNHTGSPSSLNLSINSTLNANNWN